MTADFSVTQSLDICVPFMIALNYEKVLELYRKSRTNDAEVNEALKLMMDIFHQVEDSNGSIIKYGVGREKSVIDNYSLLRTGIRMEVVHHGFGLESLGFMSKRDNPSIQEGIRNEEKRIDRHIQRLSDMHSYNIKLKK